MSQEQQMVLDTSVINALEDGGTRCEPLMKALELGYEVRLTAMSADEIVAIATIRYDGMLYCADSLDCS
jgi:hypothetical protein